MFVVEIEKRHKNLYTSLRESFPVDAEPTCAFKPCRDHDEAALPRRKSSSTSSGGTGI